MISIQKECYHQIYFYAPMSSGKSTVINALIGESLLPTSNFACTAKQMEIVINKRINSKKIYIDRRDGCTDIITNATMKDVEHCNGYECLGTRILIESNMVADIITNKPIMFIDTPGMNYYADDKHEKVTQQSLANIQEALIVYVLNVSQFGVEDDAKMLRTIADSTNNNKWIVVMNKADVLNRDTERVSDYIYYRIPKYLKEVGIDKYCVCSLSAEAALLFRRLMKGDSFSDAEADKLYNYYKYFSREDLCLGSNFYDNYSADTQQEYMVDGETYSFQQICKALHNTGIHELEYCISKALFGTYKTKRIKTAKEKSI